MMNIVNTSKAIGMDFGSREIRIVVGKASKKGIIIDKNFSIPIPSDIYKDGVIKDMEQMSYVLKNGLSSNGIHKGNVHGVINSSIIIIREVVFPKVDKEDIDNLIEYQLGDYVPIHPEDYVVKYINLGSLLEDGVEKLNMLIIGVPKDMVQDHFQLIKNAGLKPVVLDYKGNAITKLLSYGDSINNQAVEGETLGFLDLSCESTGFTIIKDEQIEVSRSIDSGFNDIIEALSDKFSISDQQAMDWILNLENINETEAESDEKSMLEEARKGLHEIADKIEMVIRYYRTRDMENNIDLLLLHGPLSQVKGIEELFIHFFDIPCVKLNSIDKLKFDGDLSKYGNAIGGLIRVSEV